MGFFDLFDFLVAKFIMPIGALILSIFTGWIVNERLLKAELTNNGTLKQPMYGIFRLCVRYVAPACIILIFLNELGLLM
jgi:NSS family neurotransmitter:Na+ symporter